MEDAQFTSYGATIKYHHGRRMEAEFTRIHSQRKHN